MQSPPRHWPLLVALVLTTTAGCPGCPPNSGVNVDGGADDAGPLDGGPADGGRLDGGTADAGAVDAGDAEDGGDGGEDRDAGEVDDGGSDVDAGSFDGGSIDGGGTDGGADAGEMLDAGIFDAGPAGDLCSSDADCVDGVCRLVPAANNVDLEGRCFATPPSTRERGDGCSDGAQCQTGLCLNALCAGACDDDTACGANQVCGSRVVTVDDVSAPADVCLRATLPEVACDNDADCVESGRICRDLNPVDGGSALFCANPAPGEGEIGAPCSGNFLEEIDFCHTGLCDDADEGEGACTAACVDDADCASAGATWTCTGSGVFGFEGRLCGERCVRESDCGSGRSCTRRQDMVDNRSEGICDGYRGAGVTGDVVTAGGECRTSLARIDGATDERYCTEICVVSDDCPNAMTCSAVTIPFPDGTGTQELLLCGR